MKNLMPLIVNVLESLDLAYTESSEFEVGQYTILTIKLLISLIKIIQTTGKMLQQSLS